MKKICQSCTMPLPDISKCGTNENGSKNENYCNHCYQNGKFVDDIMMEQMIDRCIPFLKHEMDEEEARKKLTEKLPTLKRWK